MSAARNPIFAIKSCFRCGREFPGTPAKRMCSACRQLRPYKRTIAKSLSFRESQIVNLVQQAKANKQIAYELHLSEGTIKEYLYQLFKKIGARNRTELAIWAVGQTTN